MTEKEITADFLRTALPYHKPDCAYVVTRVKKLVFSAACNCGSYKRMKEQEKK